MKILHSAIGIAFGAAVSAAGVAAFPWLFTDRLTAPLVIGETSLFGALISDLPQRLAPEAKRLEEQAVPIAFRDQVHSVRLADIGIRLNIPATAQAAARQGVWPWRGRKLGLAPELTVDSAVLVQKVNHLFRSQITLPKNASLRVTPAGTLALVPSHEGEAPDVAALVARIQNHLGANAPAPILLPIVAESPTVTNEEVSRARALAEKLLASGFTFTFADKSFGMARSQLLSMLEFVPHVDPQDPTNFILGLRLEPEALRQYLEKKVAPNINQDSVDAKFEITENAPEVRVTQFAQARPGRSLNLAASGQAVAQAIAQADTASPLVVDVTEPAIPENANLAGLGITALIGAGQSDFAGSPRNRRHNIQVGAHRYHGLLIAPGEEFSFNENLGPVTAAAGYKPELVIKGHTTTPELGGGLCQVSTTAFRAAINSGLEITARKHHAYAVRYYGTPGFDATIYPGYADLRFRNNTPGHILVQTKLEGSQLTFEFWGTPDGRTVEVAGPAPYNRRPDGAVKATLARKVTKDGHVIIDETFHSNYKSPRLFPHPTPNPS